MKYILDLDTGIDDTLAIAYGLGKNRTELHGITTTYGNIDVDNAYLNTKSILSLFSVENVPVFKGAEHSLDAKFYEQKRGGKVFHGENGIGNLRLSIPKEEKQDISAKEFLINSAKILKEQLTIVATGPLTNIAEAILEDPEIMKNINKIVIMGGALTVPGNVSIFAEANISQDVRAANIVLKSKIPIIVVGLDVTLKTLLSRRDIEEWKNKNRQSTFIYDILDYYISAHELISPGIAGCALHDPLALGIALNSRLAETFPFGLKVIDKDDQYGRMVMDQQMDERNCSVCLNVDVNNFKKDFVTTLNHLFLEFGE